ncbi:molecular chaperone HtpG [Hwanghaeella sp.]|uniref:molecular chaperone HtpG n=1 Tax=Hwanghaeella sp. TaxID=2605943 RepID=UPI003CCBA82A
MADTATKTEKHSFQAEVGRLLDIVANALYSEREIFLRELISNAADACDRLRYQALTEPALLDGGADFQIDLSFDKDGKTLTISDNGSGMTKDELIGNLGTIARSGTSNFVSQLTGDQKKDVSLIGQFGVGFYAAFMVADTVHVVSRRAGEKEAWQWVSDGRGDFTIEPASRDTRGTTITLHMKDDAVEFLAEQRIAQIIKTYSDHIPFPIKIAGEGEDYPKQLNAASALWTRNKSEVDEQQYKEFYHHVSHAFDDPWATLHFRAEGVIEYAGLIFIPTMRPFDLFHPDRKSKLKLYVKRVFITDECEDLVPSWLRFLRGVIDSQDLPLNISREMLQNNPVVSKIRSGLVKRVLGELSKKADKDADAYATFWDAFGAVLKEGVYESLEHRDELMKLMRFKSTTREGWVSLADYVAAMKEGQDTIYYIAGDDQDTLSRSPQLEGFAAKGVEVLYMTDPVDEFWIPSVGEFDGKAIKSVTRGGADLSKIKTVEKDDEKKDADKSEDNASAETVDALVTALRDALGDAVKDVRKSDRLTSSPCCLVADEGAMDMHLERLLKQHKQLDQGAPRILEINPGHALIKALSEKAAGDVKDAAFLLLDQARIMEGEPLPDPAGFAQRMTSVMTKAIR